MCPNHLCHAPVQCVIYDVLGDARRPGDTYIAATNGTGEESELDERDFPLAPTSIKGYVPQRSLLPTFALTLDTPRVERSTGLCFGGNDFSTSSLSGQSQSIPRGQSRSQVLYGGVAQRSWPPVANRRSRSNLERSGQGYGAECPRSGQGYGATRRRHGSRARPLGMRSGKFDRAAAQLSRFLWDMDSNDSQAEDGTYNSTTSDSIRSQRTRHSSNAVATGIFDTHYL